MTCIAAAFIMAATVALCYSTSSLSFVRLLTTVHATSKRQPGGAVLPIRGASLDTFDPNNKTRVALICFLNRCIQQDLKPKRKKGTRRHTIESYLPGFRLKRRQYYTMAGGGRKRPVAKALLWALCDFLIMFTHNMSDEAVIASLQPTKNENATNNLTIFGLVVALKCRCHENHDLLFCAGRWLMLRYFHFFF